MSTDQPTIKPHEAVSFDDLQPESPAVTTPIPPSAEPSERGIPGLTPDEGELPVAEGGSLKEKIIAQAKQEEAEAAAITAAKDQVTLAQESPASEAAPAEKPVIPVETLPIPEITKETVPAEPEQPTPSKKAQTQAQPSQVPAAAAPVQAQPEKTETRKQIESILQEGLGPVFLQMDQKERMAFTQAANETASKLEVLVTQFKASAKEVLRLIKVWLAKIPRVNKYFLEQASKIKTDEILQVQAQKKKESRLLH